MPELSTHAPRAGAPVPLPDGLWLFPLRADGSKKPAHTGWQQDATRDPAVIARWRAKGLNFGVSTSTFGDDKALLVVDMDVAPFRYGHATVLGL